MAKKNHVQLTLEEQEELKALVSRGWAAAYRQTHARILLLSDENQAHGARVVQQLVDVDYPDKDRIVLVMDNLNIRHPAS